MSAETPKPSRYERLGGAFSIATVDFNRSGPNEAFLSEKVSGKIRLTEPICHNFYLLCQ